MSLLIVFGASIDCDEEIKVKAPVLLILWAFVYCATAGLLFTIHAFMPKG
jgi:hypothetical protein